MIVEEKVLLELKAVRCLESVREAQLLNYLKATTIEVGLLMTMGMNQRLNGSFTINSSNNLFNPCQSVAE
jgi:GxxExxY protein